MLRLFRKKLHSSTASPGSSVVSGSGSKRDPNYHRSHQKGSSQESLSKRAKASLGAGDMRAAVRLPPGESLDEWLAVKTVDFFNEINVLYNVLVDKCTIHTCPTMSAGPKFQYLWADGEIIKKPVRLSAPEYVEHLMCWIQAKITDESIFPLETGARFPKNFKTLICKMLKRLFRVFAHIYRSHFEDMVALGGDATLNTAFKHFIFFVDEFHLINEKELAPLQSLITARLKS